MLLWLLASIGLSAIAMTPPLLLGGLAIIWRHQTRSWRDATIPVIRVLAIPVVLVAIAVFALRPGDIAPGDAYAINLEPFRDLRTSLEGGHLVGIAVMNLLGNAAMFLPFGAAVAWVFPGSRVLVVLAAAFGISLAIEVAQAMPSVARSSDVTDAIMNAVGAAVGFLAFRGAMRWSGSRTNATDARQPKRRPGGNQADEFHLLESE